MVTMNSGIRMVLISVVTVLAAACETPSPPPPSGPIIVAGAQPNTIPAGVHFAVQTEQQIEASAPSRQIFPARVTQEIRDEKGRVLVPQGAEADLVIVQAANAGATGTPQLTLGVHSITVNGQKYKVQSRSQVSGTSGLGANPRTGAFVGGGAALGSIIGVAAGGFGAGLIGGVLGAGAGAALQVVTRGDRVRVPAGEVITFRLDEPWTLSAEGPEAPIGMLR
jgi:hypothetical protein